MTEWLSLIGFGEAGSTFARAGGWDAQAFDIDPERTCCATLDGALDGAGLILSLVTADQSLIAAKEAAQSIASGALYFDMNSVAPETKHAAARLIEVAGGRYVDVAIMAPVDPARMAVPLLVSGAHAEDGAQALRAIGFSNISSVGSDIGRASAIKMIRSVMIKGQEALTAEMMLAADKAGVAAEVLASLGQDWRDRAGYNLERMTTHGLRRAAEMEEVAKTLSALGVEPLMTRGTIVRQREMAA